MDIIKYNHMSQKTIFFSQSLELNENMNIDRLMLLSEAKRDKKDLKEEMKEDLGKFYSKSDEELLKYKGDPYKFVFTWAMVAGIMLIGPLTTFLIWWAQKNTELRKTNEARERLIERIEDDIERIDNEIKTNSKLRKDQKYALLKIKSTHESCIKKVRSAMAKEKG